VNKEIGIVGCGFAVPSSARLNNVPLYQASLLTEAHDARKEREIFTGLHKRHYLLESEDLTSLVCEASHNALRIAGISERQVDRLYGYLSVSTYLAPNALYRLHDMMGLSEKCMVVPINSEFSNFLMGIIHAWEAILSNRSKTALVACGSNWTAHMDYSQGHSVCIGDGAGAAVIAHGGKWLIVDYEVETISKYYGAMTMKNRESSDNSGKFHTYYRIEPDSGIASYLRDGMDGPPRLIKKLLEKHQLKGGHVALLTHQASRTLLDHWCNEIKPGYMFDTLAEYGNMTLATLPVNLAHCWDTITQDYLVMSSLGVGFHQVVTLLKRAKE